MEWDKRQRVVGQVRKLSKYTMKRIYIYDVTCTAEVLEFVERHDLVIEHDCSNNTVRVRIPDCLLNRFILRFGDLISLIDKTWEIDV